MDPEDASGIVVNAGNAHASVVKQGDGFFCCFCYCLLRQGLM